MSIFKPLKAFFYPTIPVTTDATWEIPFGLTNAEWNDLKTLEADDGFDAWVKVLDEIAKLHGEALLSGTISDSETHFRRGVVSGIRKAALLVSELKHSEDAFVAERKRREPRERAGRVNATFGSPAWRGRAPEVSQRRGSQVHRG